MTITSSGAMVPLIYIKSKKSAVRFIILTAIFAQFT